MLRGGIGTHARRGPVAHDAGGVDDRAAAAQRRKLGAQADQQAAQVDCDDAVEIVERVGADWNHRRAGLLDPGVVERAVEAAVRPHRGRDRRRHVGLAGDVGGQRHRPVDVGRHRGNAVTVAVGQDQLRAVTGEHPRCGRTDTARRAGDQDDLARQHQRGSTQPKARWLGRPPRARQAATT